MFLSAIRIGMAQRAPVAENCSSAARESRQNPRERCMIWPGTTKPTSENHGSSGSAGAEMCHRSKGLPPGRRPGNPHAFAIASRHLIQRQRRLHRRIHLIHQATRKLTNGASDLRLPHRHQVLGSDDRVVDRDLRSHSLRIAWAVLSAYIPGL